MRGVVAFLVMIRGRAGVGGGGRGWDGGCGVNQASCVGVEVGNAVIRVACKGDVHVREHACVGSLSWGSGGAKSVPMFGVGLHAKGERYRGMWGVGG